MSEILPEGNYVARAQRGDFGESAAKKTPFVRVAFEITDGTFKGRQVTWTGYFTENTQARTIDSLRLCGCRFPDNDVMNLDGLSSATVQVVVEHESYEDQEGNPKTVAKVAWVNALAGAVRETERMPDSNAAQFRSRMKASIALVKRASGGSPANGSAAAGGQPPPAQTADDDIPF